MFFNKKKSNTCKACNSKLDKGFSFCPYCGFSLVDRKQQEKDFGLLGKNDAIDERTFVQEDSLGITDKMINSIMHSLIKNLNQQMGEVNKAELQKSPDNVKVQQFPNGIKISMGMPMNKAPKKIQKSAPVRQVTDEQIDRMSALPRVPAKTNIKRLGNKLVYEINAPGISSPEDVFISKLESGYEIKAIGKKKVYVNSIPVTLPIHGFSITEKKLLVEFNDQ